MLAETTDLSLIVEKNVRAALMEDLGPPAGKESLTIANDISAALISESEQACAQVIFREAGIFCGRLWADETARQVDTQLQLSWQAKDGDRIAADSVLLTIQGKARSLLTMERTLLNFVQLLSGVATRSAFYAKRIAHTRATILDTRKTLPGLRQAQKYAVKCGGSQNHRMGLYDAFLIKENHIQAAGGIAEVIAAAKLLAPELPLEIEVEESAQLVTAIEVGADIVMLDNFSIANLKKAVALNGGRVKLEASGGITEDSIVQVAETGVDYISIGELTKNVVPIDLSLLFK